MKPNEPRSDAWSRLAAAARTVPDHRDTAAPYGFSTRLAALAMTQERKMASLFERFAFRAVGAAALLALLSVAVNYNTISNELAPVAPPASSGVASGSDDELQAPSDDPVAVLLADDSAN